MTKPAHDRDLLRANTQAFVHGTAIYAASWFWLDSLWPGFVLVSAIGLVAALLYRAEVYVYKRKRADNPFQDPT